MSKMNDCQTYLLEIAKSEQNPAYRPSVGLDLILKTPSDSDIHKFTKDFFNFPVLAVS